MTKDGVLRIAERVIRPALGDRTIEDITVREDADWTGEPSLFVDVFLAPDTRPIDGDVSLDVRRSFRQQLLDEGEQRFAFVRLRDKAGEEEEEEDLPTEME